MTLLAPLALFGLTLLAIPIVVHLFKPRHVRQTPFSSLRWLHLTQQRMARRIQWHQVLLFLLRAGFLTLIVLGISRPIWSPAGTASGIDRILVLDVSRSMARQIEGRPSPWAAAQKIAAQLIQQTLPGDRSAILLTGSTTDVLAPWTAEGQLFLPVLSTLQPGKTETQLDSACDSLRSLLAQRRPGVTVEIVFLTDNPANGWNTSELFEFATDVSPQENLTVKLVDVSLPAPRNGWLTSARVIPAPGGPVLRVTASGQGDAPMTRTLSLAGVAGADVPATPLEITPGKPARLDLSLPQTSDILSSQITLKLEPADELPDDDVLFVDLANSGAASVLLITPPPGADAAIRPGLALETALQSLSEIGSEAVSGPVSVRSSIAVTTTEIAAADVILLADVPGFNESLATALADRVQAGAGLAIFLGPAVEFETYNRTFVHPLRPEQSLLPWELESIGVPDLKQGGLAAWKGWNSRHPLLEGLVDPKIGDLAGTASRTWYRFARGTTAADEALAQLDDGTPMLISRSLGAGRVVIWNASADDRWCDLPRRKSFVPLVDRLLIHLQGSGHRRLFEPGETPVIALSESINDAKIPAVTGPGETQLSAALLNSAGRRWLKVERVTEPGFYRVQETGAAAPGFSFVVQPGRGDSQLRAADVDQLRAWWQPIELQVEQAASISPGKVQLDRRIALEPWLVGLACLCFLAEMFLVHWLCPRMNPALSTSHQRRRGFVAPLREREGIAP